jgi:hypothetical protein
MDTPAPIKSPFSPRRSALCFDVVRASREPKFRAFFRPAKENKKQIEVLALVILED